VHRADLYLSPCTKSTTIVEANLLLLNKFCFLSSEKSYFYDAGFQFLYCLILAIADLTFTPFPQRFIPSSLVTPVLLQGKSF
jgi:hypothetical protein